MQRSSRNTEKRAADSIPHSLEVARAQLRASQCAEAAWKVQPGLEVEDW